MNNQLKDALEKAQAFLKTLLQRIEESPLWERLLNRIEALDPAQRKNLRSVGIAAGLLIPAVLILYPLISVVSGRTTQATLRDLASEMKEFNTERAVEKRAAPAPGGFQNLPISSAAEAEDSIGQYMSQIGITPEIVELKNQGEEFTLDIKELSVKQLIAMTYQMDGWYPALVTNSLRVGVHPSDKTLLTMQARYQYHPENAGKVGQGVPRSSSRGGDEFGDDEGGAAPSRPSSGGGGGGGGGSGGGGGGGSDDGGYDDYAPPPDMPADDFGDLPPPPTFDEDL